MNKEQQEETKKFVRSCQHREGAFTDRAGVPDSYYSLFGTWLSVAMGLDNELKFIGHHLQNPTGKVNNPVDEFAVLLIRVSLFGDAMPKPSFIHLLKLAFLKARQVSRIYRLFLFILLVDALYRNRMLMNAARGLLFFVSPPAGSPCSIWAAYAVARQKAGFNVLREQKMLLGFFEEGKGFKAFNSIAEADLLSTAVALFALKSTGGDLRVLAPDCLQLIQLNYDSGAFLAGNGDQERDLEYTFYGLLALGILV